LATGHTPPGASLWPKGAPHLRPHRGGGPSPTGHIRHRLPHWPEKRTAPIGKRGATPSPASHWPPTGPLLAPYWPSGEAPHWPPTGPLLAIRGGLPLAKGEAPTGQWDGRGSLWPHGSSSPPLPGHLWPKGSRPPHWPPTGHPLATKGRGGGAFARPSPDWPPTHPLPTPADRGLRTGGLPHSPDFRERWPKGGGGVFAGKGRMATGARAHRLPLGPLPSPTDWRATHWPKGPPLTGP